MLVSDIISRFFCWKHFIFNAIDTKWRMHPNLVVNCDLVGVLCTQAKVKLAFFFIRRVGRWAGMLQFMLFLIGQG